MQQILPKHWYLTVTPHETYSRMPAAEQSSSR
jgi:hypothetical protein